MLWFADKLNNSNLLKFQLLILPHHTRIEVEQYYKIQQYTPYLEAYI